MCFIYYLQIYLHTLKLPFVLILEQIPHVRCENELSHISEILLPPYLSVLAPLHLSPCCLCSLSSSGQLRAAALIASVCISYWFSPGDLILLTSLQPVQGWYGE